MTEEEWEDLKLALEKNKFFIIPFFLFAILAIIILKILGE